MNPFPPNTALSPTARRALALGLLLETVVPLLDNPQDDCPAHTDRDQGRTDSEAQLWQLLRSKCGELSSLVLRADDPGEAAAYVLGYLPKHLEYVFEELFCRKRAPVLRFEAAGQVACRNGWHDTAPGGAGTRPCPAAPEP